MSQQHASVSQGWICSDKCMCCHTEKESADQTFYHTHSQYTDTGPTNPSTDPITPGTWQGSHWRANFKVNGMIQSEKITQCKWESNPGSTTLEVDALTTWARRRSRQTDRDRQKEREYLTYVFSYQENNDLHYLVCDIVMKFFEQWQQLKQWILEQVLCFLLS